MNHTQDALSRTAHFLKTHWFAAIARLLSFVDGLPYRGRRSQSAMNANASDLQQPFRAQLYSAAQMEQHGRSLARHHVFSTTSRHDHLLARLSDNEHAITDACAHLVEASQSGRQITPAAEWLLDNYYVIEEQIRTAKRHLPKDYSRQLPRLENGHSRGLPRVYDIAQETIAHGDGRVDPETLSSFVAAYQEVVSVRLGELWAIPIMLRLALIENLRRIAVNLAATRVQRNLACEWSDRFAITAEQDPNSLILVVADMARSDPPMESAFVAEFVRRMQGQNPALLLPLTWLAQRLSENNQQIDHLVQIESQRQAADQVSVSNSIGSLRALSSLDWRVFVESLSGVEQCLRQDPVQVYSRMDFATRDQYRHAVETIARHGRLDEAAVAAHALSLAQQAHQLSYQVNGGEASTLRDDERHHHVGYYLVGKGRAELEAFALMRVGVIARCRKRLSQTPLFWYLSSIAVLSMGVSLSVVIELAHNGSSWQTCFFAGILLLVVSSQLALSLVNWLATLMVNPHPLPRLDYSKGIPIESASMVVIPCMLLSQSVVDHLVNALELRFLANRDPHLRFCLLSDFADAAQETLESDAALLLYAEKSISLLNLKYAHLPAFMNEAVALDALAADGVQARSAEPNVGAAIAAESKHFLLFHRPRKWNPREACWMGYERKRGKLADLNAYLRGHGEEAFSLIVGATPQLQQLVYIISLDSDTELPRDAARKFVATMAHPLNRAVFDAQHQRVVEGYGILQPRVSVSLPGESASLYELLCAGEVGLDPYTRSVSDVYQDLFGEGSFIGKGIYEIDTFELALKNRLPTNRILSHDLLEGCYARAGLLSDVQLFEKSPSTYLADASRRYRWVRGDWQIAAWLLRYVPENDAFVSNSQTVTSGDPGLKRPRCLTPLSLLSRWKLFDNLRRSLVPLASVIAIILCWTVWHAPLLGTIGLLMCLTLPNLLSLAFGLLQVESSVVWKQQFRSLWWASKQQWTLAFLNLSFMPFEAYANTDAILRTHWRILVSRQKLLQWRTSSETNSQLSEHWYQAIQQMWVGPVLALALACLILYVYPMSFVPALPVLLCWFLAPWTAAAVSRLRDPVVEAISAEQSAELYLLARKTWLFFERFVVAQDHWLPLDNIQQQPIEEYAHRTSPTNIGLSLLANLSAYDFAFISSSRLVERCELTLASMAKLERFERHFYNWYDTRTLQPLAPKYVSSVDSGNLAGHLLVLGAGLQELEFRPLFVWKSFSRLRVTFQLLQLHLLDTERIALSDLDMNLHHTCEQSDGNLAQAHQALQSLALHCQTLANVVDCDRTEILRVWCDAFTVQCQDLLADLEWHCPWLMEADYLAPWVARELQQILEIPSLSSLLGFEYESRAVLFFQSEVIHVSSISVAPSDVSEAVSRLLKAIAKGSEAARIRLDAIQNMGAQIADFSDLSFDFLFDRNTQLLAIGYNVNERRLDSSYYDLLASEARLTTFIGIAQNKLPQESWFVLGRQLTIAEEEPILLSWSGSMFEYLMPLLVMPNYQHTLLNQTYRSAVQRQISYAKQRGIPWGISESGYYAFDTDSNYQYRAFGVPGLGFKRGLGDDLVVAPYASMLALMVAPKAACENLSRMRELGFEGEYGFYEAIDFSANRLLRGQEFAVVQSFMAHHQGMSLLAMSYLLLDRPLQRRFEAEPCLHATLSLLYERVPKTSSSYSNTSELADIRTNSNEQVFAKRILHRADHRLPEVQLLSNGRYQLMITSAGGSASRWNDLALTRWREDSTRDNWGAFLYLRELDSSGLPIFPYWSSGLQPSLVEPDSMEVIFSEGRAEFRRQDGHFLQHTEIVLSPEDDIELRRTKITNRSRLARTIELTSYAELVLAKASADISHPAFSNLFLQTEIVDARHAILCTRRPRSSEEVNPHLFHVAALHGLPMLDISYETDRAKFIGRTRNLTAPLAMLESGPLSNSSGSVLDPVASIRFRVRIEPEQTISFDFVTGVAPNREEALGLVEKYSDRHLADRVIELSWTHSQVTLRQLNISEVEAQVYAKLASSIIYVNPLLRADPATLLRNRKAQADLWGYAISGDLPIVLLQIKDQEHIQLVQQLVKAHTYWRAKGLAVDLVIWNEEHNGYRQELQEQILGLIAALPVLSNAAVGEEKQGSIFVRSIDQISVEDRILFQSVARITLSDTDGSLADQLGRRPMAELRIPRLITSSAVSKAGGLGGSLGGGLSSGIGGAISIVVNTMVSTAEIISTISKVEKAGLFLSGLFVDRAKNETGKPLLMANGVGGFSEDGREYVINTNALVKTPAPWVNVLANAHFGTVISESGQSYTWSQNAHEFRLTPWNNDAVSDSGGEVFYIRNEETGKFWSPVALPMDAFTGKPNVSPTAMPSSMLSGSTGAASEQRSKSSKYQCRHGFGYSCFEHEEEEVASTLTVSVALDDAVKFSILTLRNLGTRSKKLSVTAYVEWVLAELRSKTQMHVITQLAPESDAILATNHYSSEFHRQVAFFQLLPYMDGALSSRTSYTADRLDFIGRNRSLQNPLAMEKQYLSGRVGAGFDPCAALQTKFDLLPGETVELVFMLGTTDTRIAPITSVLKNYARPNYVREQLQRVKDYWRQTLDVVQVKTPEASFDVLANGWLMYQTLACRMWARSGFYQSGGAFGYRDQLQDSMALVIGQSALTRAQILLAAAHQFVEGDVQHWWHPPGDRGVRTRCADDYLWLPFTLLRYLKVTADHSILAEPVGFISGRALNRDEDSYFDLPVKSDQTADLYQHAVLAIEHGLRFGEHGLCLIGNGDWNDGFDKVGHLGKGESVWLSFFLYQILIDFAPVVEQRGDVARAAKWRAVAAQLQAAIEKNAWDGAWYRRAYFDDGSVLGSHENDACQIDSISQSWAVMSNAADPERVRTAMESVFQRLVEKDAGLIRLLAPPFGGFDDPAGVDQKHGQNPGYIRGYLPGVRENGGQYTHAAIWAVMAYAQLNEPEVAWQLMQLINPVKHSDEPAKMAVYKVEPYVLAADVYAIAPLTGRGGWTWYTGSAGWMLRLMRESLLGLQIEGERMRIVPCIPRHWPGFSMRCQLKNTWYEIEVTQTLEIEASVKGGGSQSHRHTWLDGRELDSDWISLEENGAEKKVEVKLELRA